MSDLNQFTCTGRLGADPECRKFQSGDPVVNLRIAISDNWKDKEGNRQERTLWLPVKITNKGLCSVAERFLSKGSKVALSGKLESRSYEKDGQTHYVTEVVLGPFNGSLTMLDSKGGDAGDTDGQRKAPEHAASDDDDEIIPF
jgi:single-strand DNA-binding protein